MFLLGMICGGKLAYYDIKIQKQKNDDTVKDMKDRFIAQMGRNCPIEDTTSLE